MELKTIVAIVLVVVIVGGFVFLQIKNRKKQFDCLWGRAKLCPFYKE